MIFDQIMGITRIIAPNNQFGDFFGNEDTVIFPKRKITGDNFQENAKPSSPILQPAFVRFKPAFLTQDAQNPADFRTNVH